MTKPSSLEVFITIILFSIIAFMICGMGKKEKIIEDLDEKEIPCILPDCIEANGIKIDLSKPSCIEVNGKRFNAYNAFCGNSTCNWWDSKGKFSMSKSATITEGQCE